jgi:small-conductance mechanosensitive channel
VDRERLLLRLDRLAAGRSATIRIDEGARLDPRTGAAFTTVTRLLVAEFVIGAGAVVEAVSVAASGRTVSPLVWWRLVVIFGIAGTLFYFVWRARLGLWWAYSRLRLFSIVFPVVAISTCLIPGLYPAWMVVEQLLFSAVLLIVWRVLSRGHLRAAYARPDRAASRQSGPPR